jgi:hypothetical protein
MPVADMRGFVYALEPLRRRRAWQLDAAMAKLASLQKRLADARTRLQQAEGESVSQAQLAAKDWEQRGDPATQAGLLAYLLRLQQRKALIEIEIKSLQEELVMARQETLQRQQRVESLQQHRAETQSVYRVEQERKSGAQADQDWTARKLPAAGDAQ